MTSWLEAEQINRLASDPARRTSPIPLLAVDPRRPFVPEEYTQLFYTPIYESLHFEHRLRYNQLFGLRINEYIMMLEADLVARLLRPLSRHKAVAGDADLIEALETMIREEEAHYAYFAALNRACRPDLYPPGADRLFSDLPVWTKGMFLMAGALAGKLAFAMWFLMAMEESSISMAREMLVRPKTKTLGELDPAFAAVHREHMKDETRHLHVDRILIDRAIDAVRSTARRGANAWMFRTMLKGVTRPTRSGSGVKVIHQLVRDMPELGSRKEEMIRALLELNSDRRFQESLFNRRIMPLTFRLFDKAPELARLGEKMPGYDRP